jgi:hypothetical protein
MVSSDRSFPPIAPANVNDHLLLAETIAAIVVERPEPTEAKPQHLCLGAGYDNEPSREVIKEHGYCGHIRPARGEHPDRQGAKKHRPRRRVVERTLLVELEMSRPVGAPREEERELPRPSSVRMCAVLVSPASCQEAWLIAITAYCRYFLF